MTKTDAEERKAMEMAKIEWIKCESHGGIIESWTAQFSNGKQETYTGELPPKNVSRFCRMARYGYKDMHGSFTGEIMVDWYSNNTLSADFRNSLYQ